MGKINIILLLAEFILVIIYLPHFIAGYFLRTENYLVDQYIDLNILIIIGLISCFRFFWSNKSIKSLSLGGGIFLIYISIVTVVYFHSQNLINTKNTYYYSCGFSLVVPATSPSYDGERWDREENLYNQEYLGKSENLLSDGAYQKTCETEIESGSGKVYFPKMKITTIYDKTTQGKDLDELLRDRWFNFLSSDDIFEIIKDNDKSIDALKSYLIYDPGKKDKTDKLITLRNFSKEKISGIYKKSSINNNEALSFGSIGILGEKLFLISNGKGVITKISCSDSNLDYVNQNLQDPLGCEKAISTFRIHELPARLLNDQPYDSNSTSEEPDTVEPVYDNTIPNYLETKGLTGIFISTGTGVIFITADVQKYCPMLRNSRGLQKQISGITFDYDISKDDNYPEKIQEEYIAMVNGNCAHIVTHYKPDLGGKNISEDILNTFNFKMN